MSKKKPSPKNNNDIKITAIVIGLFVAAVILGFILTKAKQQTPEVSSPTPVVLPKVYLPVENNVSEEAPAVQAPQPQPLEAVQGSGQRIAIILDDWGYTTMNCKYLDEIAEPLTISILPGLRHTKDAAACAQRAHKLAMLHLPLEAMHNFDFYPPNYVIKTTMSPQLVAQIVEKDLNQLPSIEGVNNHMGSKATADKALMKVILKILKKRGLFWVDSMTSPHSVSAQVAEEMGLSFGKRDVFLDNVNTTDAITKQIVALARVARHKGYAVAIGHDRHLTLQVLKDEIPWLEKQGFTIVSIKELLRRE